MGYQIRASRPVGNAGVELAGGGWVRFADALRDFRKWAARGYDVRLVHRGVTLIETGAAPTREVA